MKVYTRTGDAGTTSLVGGTRVPKTNPRLEAYGTADELNSHIGLLLALPQVPADVAECLEWVQNRLFDLGAELATEPDSAWQPDRIDDEDVTRLENEIDKMEAQLPRHNRFILPGGCTASAQANVARTVARRCERRMLALASAEPGCPVAAPALRFINRLSDYLFVASRYINTTNSIPEKFWQKKP